MRRRRTMRDIKGKGCDGGHRIGFSDFKTSGKFEASKNTQTRRMFVGAIDEIETMIGNKDKEKFADRIDKDWRSVCTLQSGWKWECERYLCACVQNVN